MEPNIERWGRENYPRLMTNPELIESLYKKKVMHQPTILQAVAYPLVKVGAVRPENAVTLIVTKVDSSVRSVEGGVCKQCSKKICTETGHGPERKPFYICTMVAGDDTASMTFKRIGSEKEPIEIIQQNEEFIISGTLHEKEKFGREFDIKSVEALTKEQLTAWDALADYYDVHGGEAGISEEEFSLQTKNREVALKPFMEKVFISRAGGRVKW